jgi:energy-coupling factor transporter transmembrane protein EcfT
LLAVMMPFVLRALRRANEIAVAMELRGFGYRKERTWQRSIALGSWDRIILVMLAIAAIAYLGLRLRDPGWFV